MSTPDAFAASLASYSEAFDKLAQAFAPTRESLAAFSRAVTRSAWYKARAAKAALVALLNKYGASRSRSLWLEPLVLHEARAALSLSPPPREPVLVTSQGPHAPPGSSDYRSGARPYQQTESERLRAVLLRDTPRDT